MHTILTKGYSWQPDTRHSKHLCLQGTFLLLIFHSNTWKKYLIYLSMLIHPLYGSIKNIRALSIHQYLSSCDHVILLYSVVISSVAFVSFFPFSGTRLPFCYPLCPMIICYPGDMPWPPPFNLVNFLNGIFDLGSCVCLRFYTCLVFMHLASFFPWLSEKQDAVLFNISYSLI